MDGINWNGLNNMNRTMPGNTIQPQPIPMPTQPQVQLPLLSVIYVDGRQGAVDFPTPPNCPGIPIFDRNSPTLFVKTTDSYGNMTALLEFDMTPKKSPADQQNEAMAAFDERLKRIEEAILNVSQSNISSIEPATANAEPIDVVATTKGDPSRKHRR